MINNINYIQPKWPAPTHVKAYTTFRLGGSSSKPYDSFNLAFHVGDKEENVQNNRSLLKSLLQLPNEPIWIEQIHGNTIVEAQPSNRFKEADALYTHQPNQICVIQTADCLPILLTDQKGTTVSAIHAGWRGLANDIISKTLDHLSCKRNELLAWLGPAISQKHFEVGEDVYKVFIAQNPDTESAFIPSQPTKWFADLYAIAKIQLKKLGVDAVYGGNYCTFAESDKFFSYRRDQGKTGRMVSLIWMDGSSSI